MAEYSEYLIQGKTLDATASTIRRYTPRKTEFIPMVEGSSGHIPYGSVSVYSCEWVDDFGEDGGYEGGSGDTIVAYTFLKNNEGTLVPVLYDTELENYKEPDTYEPFFYEGVAEIDGKQYDKWRKIELGDSTSGFSKNETFIWDTQARYYIYTDVIVTDNGIVIDSGIDPEDFPQEIDEVYTTGYTEGSNAGREVGYTEGKADGIAITNDATAVAANMHSGKTAYVKGKKITGIAKTYKEGWDYGVTEVVNLLTFQSRLTADLQEGPGYYRSSSFRNRGLNFEALVEIEDACISSSPYYISINNHHPTLNLEVYILGLTEEGNMAAEETFSVSAKGSNSHYVSEGFLDRTSGGKYYALYWRFEE